MSKSDIYYLQVAYLNPKAKAIAEPVEIEAKTTKELIEKLAETLGYTVIVEPKVNQRGAI